MKAAALEADVTTVTEARDDLKREVELLRKTLILAEAEAAKATAANAEKARLEDELAEALKEVDTLGDKLQSEVNEPSLPFMHAVSSQGQRMPVFKAQQLSSMPNCSSRLKRPVRNSKDGAKKQSYTGKLLLKCAEANKLRTDMTDGSQGRDELLERLEGLESELADAVELAKVSASERDSLAADAAACDSARHEASRYLPDSPHFS